MLRKEQVLKSIKELPDQFTIDELIDKGHIAQQDR